MSTIKSVAVKNLSLDLKNYRTTPRANEVACVHALIAIDTDWFWALMESLLEDGYLPTENILVLENGKKVVKEGNRRIAALKLIHGYIKRDEFDLPVAIEERIKSIPATWKTQNASVPCTVYSPKEASAVDKIVTLTHGKGEKAGRAKWKAVARARHARDINGSKEPALDMLEKYLLSGKTATPSQAERWSGDYPLSVLDEAIKKLAPRLGLKTSNDLSVAYPKQVSGYKMALDRILSDIGSEIIGFKEIRSADKDFGDEYGIPQTAKKSNGKGSDGAAQAGSNSNTATAASGGSASSTSSANSPTAAAKKGPAFALDDPKSVAAALKQFKPLGKNREKVVTLLDEIRRLKIADHPYSFCFLLRSMFEISAKAYCEDHKAANGPVATKSDGTDVSLAVLLKSIAEHLHKNKADKAMLKLLHGPIVELASHDSVLSVTSMNQLVHNPKFGLKASDICQVFNRVFPLLEQMNR